MEDPFAKAVTRCTGGWRYPAGITACVGSRNCRDSRLRVYASATSRASGIQCPPMRLLQGSRISQMR